MTDVASDAEAGKAAVSGAGAVDDGLAAELVAGFCWSDQGVQGRQPAAPKRESPGTRRGRPAGVAQWRLGRRRRG